MDSSAVTSQLSLLRNETELVSIDDALFQMRLAKDPDELKLMKSAIRCTEVMYERAPDHRAGHPRDARVLRAARRRG